MTAFSPDRRAAAALAVCLWLSGCAQLPERPADVATGPVLSGRLLVRVDASSQQAAQSWSAGFELLGDDRQGRLTLISPLGTQLAQAHWGPQGVWLQTGDGRRDFSDLDALARDALGQAIPLAALTHWLSGHAWPGAASTALPEGPAFEQLGWRVDLRQHASDGRVEARREQPAPALLVRAMLDR